jgi:tetratricopeptide (TPR) repeat protein
VLVLVVVSLAWNWRFFQGHFEIKAAFAAMGKADVKEAAQQMAAAAKHVPESLELQELAAFFRGVACLNEDKSEEAQQCFSRCPHLPPEYGASQLLQRATAGAAFDRKDYDRFLEVAEEMARQQPQDPVARAQVASALACQYALRGEEELRRRAEAKLEEAKALGNEPIQAMRYEERIRHRLQTREIIDSQEFLRRFPHGWPPSGEPKS